MHTILFLFRSNKAGPLCNYPEDRVIHCFVPPCAPLKLWTSPHPVTACVTSYTKNHAEMPWPCKWSHCIASTPMSLTRCCTSTCVFRARSRPAPSARKAKKSCQWCIYNVEVNKPCSAWHAMCRLSSTAACPGHLLSPSPTSDGNSFNAASTYSAAQAQPTLGATLRFKDPAFGIIYVPPVFHALRAMGLCIQMGRRGWCVVAVIVCTGGRYVVSHGACCSCILLKNPPREQMNDNNTHF